MIIESIIKRDPPTEIDLDGTVYKFKPDEHGRHVADVTDKRHIARLLSITEGYQLPGDEPLASDVQAELDREIEQRSNPVSQPVLTPTDSQALKGSTVHPAVIDLGDGKQVAIDEVIDTAYQESGLTTAEWNDLSDDDRHNLIDAILDAMAPADEGGALNADGSITPIEQLPRDTLLQMASDAGIGDAASLSDADLAAAVKAKLMGSVDDVVDADNDPAAPPANEKPADDKAQHDAERDAVAKEYKAKFGKLPHYKWTIEKIREELAKPAPGEGAA